MVQQFKQNDIYLMRIDFIGYGIKDILFRVYDLIQKQGTKPEVWGKVALAYNVDRMTEDIYMLATHVKLTDVLLFYLGFERSDPLPGSKTLCHYVQYGEVNGKPVMIQLVPEDEAFSLVRMKEEDGLFEIIRRIETLDELQDAVREYYKAELPVDLEKMNHACLVEPSVPELSNFIAANLEQYGCLYLGQVKNMLKVEKNLLDYDAETVIKYGLAHGIFKLQVNMYGLILEKV